MQEGGEERESTIWRWTGDFGRFTFFLEIHVVPQRQLLRSTSSDIH